MDLTPTNSVFCDELVADIRTAAETIVPLLDSKVGQSFDEEITDWCQMHGLDPAGGTATKTFVARQAVLNLFLKTTLYEWHHQHGSFPAFIGALRKTLQNAADSVESTAFDEYILDDLAWLADAEALMRVLENRDRLLESTEPAEDIGRLYEALTQNESRRPLGQFRTLPEIADLMRKWAASNTDNVFDPGMGAGQLSSPFHPSWVVNTEPEHVTGIDRSQLSILMGTTALTLAKQSHAPHTADFLTLSPSDIATDIDAIVCNPPYTRHQELPAEYKATIHDQIQRSTGLEICSTSPLYAYFIYHARGFLHPGDRAAFLTPQTFLATNYGEHLKRFLVNAFDVKALIQFNPERIAVFDDALATGLLLFLEATDDSNPGGPTRFIQIDEIPGLETLRDAIEGGQHGETPWGFVNPVEQQDLDPHENWQSLFDPVDVETAHLTPLSDIADVSRGLSTGENDYFCLTQAEVDTNAIQDEHLSQLVPSPRYIAGYDFTERDWQHHRSDEHTAWLLYLTGEIDGVPQTIPTADVGAIDWPSRDEDRGSPKGIVGYLQSGLTEHESLTDRTTIRNRSPWYRVERRDPAPILVPMMGRTEFRAILNETAARHRNHYLGIYPGDYLDAVEQKALLAYLNSSVADEIVRQHERTYAGGLAKLEPSDLADIPAIDPRELSGTLVADLAALFDELRESHRRNECDTDIGNRIDELIKQGM